MLRLGDFKQSAFAPGYEGFADSLEFFPFLANASGICLSYLAILFVALGDGLEQIGEFGHHALGVGKEAFG